MTLHIGPMLLLAGSLLLAAAVLVALSERADRREKTASDLAEASAKAAAGMPSGHPELLTRLLPPADEIWLTGVAEELGLEAAG